MQGTKVKKESLRSCNRIHTTGILYYPIINTTSLQYYNNTILAGRPGSSEVTSLPSDTLGREFDPGKRDFSHQKKNAQQVEND